MAFPLGLSSLLRSPLMLFLIILLSCLDCGRSQDLKFSFDTFSQSDWPSLDFSVGSSGIQGTALQVTFDTGSGSASIYNSSGQITYYKSLRIWDPKYNYTASFNTSFLLNMGPIAGADGRNTSGGGMAFFLSSHRANETQIISSYGEWLGLFDASLNASAAGADSLQRLVAVEFDTFKDAFDPDSNHVGIDINTTVSVHTEALTPQNVFLDRNTSTNTSVWVDYDGHGHLLDVYLANDGSSMTKPVRPVVSQFQIDLSQYLPEIIYVGFSASTGTASETHCVLMWNFTSEGLPASSSGSSSALLVGLTVGVSALIVLLLVVTVLILVVARKRRRRTDLLKSWPNLNYGPREFTYRELKKATKGFSADLLLGKGGFGAVYRGTLPSDNSAVAVKSLSQRSKQGEREFLAEVTIIGRLRHKNLVRLLGWSYDRWRGRLLLVYEYMANGSLDKWLTGVGGHDVLGWERRYHVLKGLAAGLLYLHEEWEMVVVHRDLKPSNLMLDADFNARLGDFGLARMIEGSDGSNGTETRTIAGTPGYMAPESMETGMVTKESDLYSFGAVAVELAMGRRLSAEVLHSLWLLHEEGRLLEAADQRLESYDAKEMELLLTLGLACCHPHPLSRPSIRQIVQALSSVSVSFPLPTFPSPPPSVPSPPLTLAFLLATSSQVSTPSFSTEHLTAR